jgi:putative tryptophan/tyrosine transport system substrate-binding protein
MALNIGRRHFLTTLGGAAVAWPLSVQAQQPAPMRRIGVLMPFPQDDAAVQSFLIAFRNALADLGWTAGRNVTFDYRWTAGSNDLVRTYAKELVTLAPDLILTASVQLVSALHDETRAIPILFGGSSDPVELGLVESLAHPGGNVTGFTSMQIETTVKYLELIKELYPRVTRILVVMNAKDPSNLGRMRAIEAGGPSMKVAVSQTDLSLAPDIDRVIGGFASAPTGGLIVLPSTLTIHKMDTIVMLTAQHRLPAIYPFRSWAAAGGLVTYGSDEADQFRRAASYADRILRGEKPADLPIQAPTKYELVINIKTAKALGLDVPAQLLARADEVIE